MDSKIWLAPLLLGAALAGCGAGTERNSAQPNGATELAAQPVKEEHRSLELTPAWLAGRWQTGDGNCGAGDTLFTLAPDGGYTFLQEQGRWSLAGNQLTTEVTAAGDDGGVSVGDRTVTEVRPIGPNEAEFRAADGPPIRVFRCHGG